MKVDLTNIIRVEMPEVMWLGKNREWLEENYPGKWIAIKGDELIAVGDTLDQVLNQAQEKGVEDPLVAGVKSKEYRKVFLIRSPRLVRDASP
jgi:hypothetical protein